MFAPDRHQDGPVRQYAVRMTRQKDEELELLRRQPDLAGAHQDAPAIEVDHQRAEIEPAVVGHRRDSTQRRSHPREQFLGIERLAHVIIGALFERRHFVLLAGFRRQYDDRHIGSLPHARADLEAVVIREAQVEHDQLRPMPIQCLEGGLRRRGALHVVALHHEQQRETLLQKRIVIDDQNASRPRHDRLSCKTKSS